jgi:hypothetical protein
MPPPPHKFRGLAPPLNIDLRMSRTLGPHIGGRTEKNHGIMAPIPVVSRLSSDIVVLEIGTNDLSSLSPEVVGLQIEELVVLLREAYKVKVVCVCLVTPRWRNRHFNITRLILNNYLTVVLEYILKVFSWPHRGFTQP